MNFFIRDFMNDAEPGDWMMLVVCVAAIVIAFVIGE